MLKLLPEQREFFKQIADLAFINPFGEDRERADCRLLAIPTQSLPLFQRTEKLQVLLKERLRQLQLLSTFDVSAISESDREIMKFVWLFYQFHEFQDRFNRFIIDQKSAGDLSLELPFADEIIGCFQQSGFNEEESSKYIALFFQLYRGFHFINSSLSGECPSIVQLRMRLWNNIFTFNPHWYLDYLIGRMEEFSTLLLGQTGSGKSLVAHAIGCSGFIPWEPRRKRFQESFTRSFQAINLAQFPASLLESELFGHKKGSFTGAIENHEGIFARCSANGAVFIDEIGDIDLPTQVKLLNVIQDRTFSPVGSHDKLRFAGRVISATNRDIQKLRKDGLFRDDLYYRLCSDIIVMPRLQQRLQENPGELKTLIAGLLNRVMADPDERLLSRIVKRIQATVPANYAWPGNVRELEQCIRRICLTGDYQAVKVANLDNEQSSFYLPDGVDLSAQQMMQNYCRFLYEKYGSYEAVARISNLDRRTVKKHIGF